MKILIVDDEEMIRGVLRIYIVEDLRIFPSGVLVR